MSIILIKKLRKYIDALEEANSILILIILDELKETTGYALGKRLSKETNGEYYLSQGSVELRLCSFIGKSLVSLKEIFKGKRKRKIYSLTSDGQKLVKALKKFLDELEE